MDGVLCMRFLPSPGGESNFPGGGLCKHRAGPELKWKVQWEEAAATRTEQGLRPLNRLPDTVIADFNRGYGGPTGGRGRTRARLHQ